MGVDHCPRITSWNVSCTGVRSDRLRTISMNVFLIMRLKEAPLSTRVLATLCHPIRSLTTKGKFRLESSVSRWSSGTNEMSVSTTSFFFEAMDMLHPKITLISSS
jgi:hypothetical protein